MKTLWLLLFVGPFLVNQAWAQPDIWVENYGPVPRDQVTGPDTTSQDEKFRWLYEIIFANDIRTQFPDESFKSFRVHLKDSFQIFPRPETILSGNLNDLAQIKGLMTYVGIFKKKYHFDLIRSPGLEIVLNVRVFLRNASAKDTIDFSQKMIEASELWNASRVQFDFPYRFHFEIVSDSKSAHFSVNVLDETRGPYDTNWGRDWTSQVVAHEVGHMLGLGDEYETLSGEFNCYKPSLMCSAWKGALMEHHYYFVLRRLIK